MLVSSLTEKQKMSTIIRLIRVYSTKLNLNSIKINQVQLDFHLFIVAGTSYIYVDVAMWNTMNVKLNQQNFDQFKPFI